MARNEAENWKIAYNIEVKVGETPNGRVSLKLPFVFCNFDEERNIVWDITCWGNKNQPMTSSYPTEQLCKKLNGKFDKISADTVFMHAARHFADLNLIHRDIKLEHIGVLVSVDKRGAISDPVFVFIDLEIVERAQAGEDAMAIMIAQWNEKRNA